MGGNGSGASGRCSGICVESCLAIDAAWWSREGMLRRDTVRSGVLRWINSATGEVTSSIGFAIDTKEPWTGTVQLTYTWNSSERIEYTYFLQKTRPNFGGVRWWFTCPL